MNIYLDVFLTFSKIGAFTLGGGYAMLPLIEREVVDNKHWLQKEEFLDVIAVAQSLPGVMAVNTSIFIGYRLKGVLGSIVSLLATVLPSFVIILLIAMFFTHFKDNAVVAAIFKGIRPAVVALIAVPVFTTAKSAGITWKTVVIPIIAAILISFLGVSPIWIVLVAGLGGLIYGKFTGNTKQAEE
jgi:chromate transporter